MMSRNLDRTGYNPNETVITKDNVGKLVPTWQFRTKAPVAASPSVATIDLPNEGPTRLVIFGSYDGNVYAARAKDGSEVWRYAVKPDAGISYGLIASSASIAVVDGKPRVYVGGGETMYALDAATGKEVWQFDAGTGCTTCDRKTERNEILSSPAVLPDQDLVLFGMDINDNAPGKGGFFAVSAKEGRLRWYFDVDTATACRPAAADNIRRFDGYHSAEALGLASDFLSTREGCDFDRTETACGGVWSPVSVDLQRKLIFFSSTNCDTDNDPSTPDPPPPMPGDNESVVVLHYDGTPAWSWRPREVDNNDLAFGAAPNLFKATIGGKERDVVGLGGKDGTYYLLDRDGKSAATGKIEPYWKRQVVPGGAIGGMTGTPAVANGRVYFGTAFGVSVDKPQSPSAWALSTGTGEVAWSQPDAAPFYGATSVIPGVAFMGGADFSMRAFDSETGAILLKLPLGGLGFSQAAVVDGFVYMGSGFGARGAGGTDIEEVLARTPAGVWAFCVEGTEGCTRAPTPTPTAP